MRCHQLIRLIPATVLRGKSASQLARPRLRPARWVVAFMMGALFVAGMAGCGSGGEESASASGGEDAGFVGTVEGTDAFIGLVVADSDTDEDEALVYVCNGEEGIREWFKAEVDDPTSFTLTNDGGGTVTAELTDDTWSGQVTLADGSTHAFTTVAADGDEQGGAGIFEVDDPDATADGIWAAWVIDNDGNERGAWLQRSSFIQTQPLSTSRFAVSKFVQMNGFIGMNGIIEMNG